MIRIKTNIHVLKRYFSYRSAQKESRHGVKRQKKRKDAKLRDKSQSEQRTGLGQYCNTYLLTQHYRHTYTNTLKTFTRQLKTVEIQKGNKCKLPLKPHI